MLESLLAAPGHVLNNQFRSVVVEQVILFSRVDMDRNLGVEDRRDDFVGGWHNILLRQGGLDGHVAGFIGFVRSVDCSADCWEIEIVYVCGDVRVGGAVIVNVVAAEAVKHVEKVSGL